FRSCLIITFTLAKSAIPVNLKKIALKAPRQQERLSGGAAGDAGEVEESVPVEAFLDRAHCFWISRILMFRNETWPWSPCNAMAPLGALAKSGMAANLLLATRALKSSLPRT